MGLNKENKMKNLNNQYEKLQKNLLKDCFNKYTPATNTKVINKFASQMRYLEKMIRPDIQTKKN